MLYERLTELIQKKFNIYCICFLLFFSPKHEKKLIMQPRFEFQDVLYVHEVLIYFL